MQYYTKEEARRIILNAPIRLSIVDNTNPNREAILAAYEIARGDGPILAVACGFQLGLALGKRIERAKRRGMVKHE